MQDFLTPEQIAQAIRNAEMEAVKLGRLLEVEENSEKRWVQFQQVTRRIARLQEVLEKVEMGEVIESIQFKRNLLLFLLSIGSLGLIMVVVKKI